MTALTLSNLSREEFLLGEDYAYYGMPLPADATVPLTQGYKHKLNTSTALKGNADRYIRKWLQLRRSALHRRRVVDEQVTPSLLKDLDTPYCPVSYARLTHSTGLDTDWSVDRVCNEAGYAKGNLAIISTRVNVAKGSKSFKDVQAIVAGSVSDMALTADEWLRLLVLMTGPEFAHSKLDVVVPFIVDMPPTLHCPPSIHLQLVLVSIATVPHERARLDAAKCAIQGLLGTTSRVRFEHLLTKLKSRAARQQPYCPSKLFSNPTLFDKFELMYSQLTVKEKGDLMRLMGYDESGQLASSASLAPWQRLTGGYLV
jgi:hypothetical protein